MKTLVLLLEEPSAKAMLENWLPNILPADFVPRFIVFEGKRDLEKQLARRLRGWLHPDSFFVVLRDQDAADCVAVKRELFEKCRDAGRPETLVRIGRNSPRYSAGAPGFMSNVS